MHGYDLRRHLRENYGLLANLSFGSLYPALARLEADGAVTGSKTPPQLAVAGDPRSPLDEIPFTGSLGGERAAARAYRGAKPTMDFVNRGVRGTRSRKVYEITPRGKQIFEELLTASDARPEDGRAFSLRLSFARHLSPAERIALLERQSARLADDLAKAERLATRSAHRRDAYEQSVLDHARALLRGELEWVRELLDAERDGAVDRRQLSGGYTDFEEERERT